MKAILLFFSVGVLCSVGFAKTSGSVLNQGFRSIDGQPMELSQLLGEKFRGVLLVNIATRCGYSPQLKDLEVLAKKYKKLLVLGVPSNDFGEQSPEKPKALKRFCRLTYGVEFPLTEKMKVSGAKKHPFFSKVLAQDKSQREIQWNFEKFFLDNKGKLLKRWSSKDKVLDGSIESFIQSKIQ